MKIALAISDLTVPGGAQRQVLELAKNLRARDHEVSIYCLNYDSPSCFPEIAKNLEIRYLYKGKKQSFQKPLLIIQKIAQFVNRVREMKKIARMIDLKTDLLNIHDGDVQWLAYYFKKRYQSKKVVWMCNDPPWVFTGAEKGDLNVVRNPLYRLPVIILSFLEKRIVKAVDEIMVLDYFNQKKISKYYRRKSQVVRSGINLDSFKPPKQRKFSQKYLKILGVGHFLRHRRFEDLILAAKILKDKGYQDFEINLIGKQVMLDQGYFESIKSLVAEYQLEKQVHFLGQVSEAGLKRVYQESDIFVFPNHNQTWGLAVFEAMLSGLPALVSKSTGAAEVLTNYENAILIPPKNPKVLAEKLVTLIENPNLRKKLSENGRKLVLNNLSWDKYANEMEAVFKKQPSLK